MLSYIEQTHRGSTEQGKSHLASQSLLTVFLQSSKHQLKLCRRISYLYFLPINHCSSILLSMFVQNSDLLRRTPRYSHSPRPIFFSLGKNVSFAILLFFCFCSEALRRAMRNKTELKLKSQTQVNYFYI